ncbi:putative ADP-ribosylation factor GTPase-activating protein AGD14 [Canna indica]|uniref:ADP-ribosylation factor GTPase-activating protein AGD14 n=1 Tax=Canna indica TaxID=4628 RepID=A0AAQ3KTK7_9LILI|nr:putative ADP-ribosylation factor GTPase-activating protein AGD14 [Canna indica]
MSSKKEDERNEKVIRGLLKLPPNRKCINCNSLGPQYVCVNFWTFICVTCSGIHREFTHRVKSISMAKFTSQEVEALQRGGNQRAREIFLKDWDTERMRLPDSSNLDKLREFIKSVYVDKKYAGGRSFDKPPRDTQNHKNHEEHRRASSYHSYSQSPPNEYQYEERYAGKKSGMLTRKPGSDRGLYEGKISSFMYSPGYQGKQTYEDRFANETPNSRNSDYSVTSGGDSSRYDGQSPNLQDNGYNSPPLRQVRDILIEDARPQALNTYPDTNTKNNLSGFPRPQRTASSSSFGSFDSNSASPAPSSSVNIIDLVLEPENCSPSKHPDAPVAPSLTQTSASIHARSEDLFGLPIMQQPVPSSDSVTDLFAVNHQPLSTTHSEGNELPKPFSESVGWATFDLPHQPNPSLELNKDPPTTISQANIHQFPQDATQDLFLFFPDQQNEIMPPTDANRSTQTWDAFGFSDGIFQPALHENLPQISEAPIRVHDPPASGLLYASLQDQEVLVEDGSQNLGTDEFSALSTPIDGLTGPLFPSVLPLKGGTTLERKSTNPFDLPYDSNLEANNLFPEMSSLQTALPDPLLHTDLLGGLHQSWFPQNPVSTFPPSIPQGSLAYNGGQIASSQLRDITSQGPVASVGGNPFA